MIETLFTQTLKGKAGPDIPFWLMRQAGRYLPEYRALREKAGSFLDLCYTPDYAAEVTLQPIRRFGMDAAILFSDILVVPHGLGRDLTFVTGEGPKLNPLQTPGEIGDINHDAFDKTVSPVYETVRRVRAELDKTRALIGFAGAPFTVACYMIQGHGGTGFPLTLTFARDHRADFLKLLDIIVDATARYLKGQIAAGCDAIQIFDSWAGLVGDADIDDFIITPTRKIVELVRADYPTIPVIGFAREAVRHYTAYGEKTGVDAIGIGHETRLGDVKTSKCLQGNLAPELLLAGGDAMVAEIRRIKAEMKGRPFVFNLGHGVIKETPPEHVALLARTVREG